MEHIVIKKEGPFFLALQSKNRSIAIYYILLFPIWSNPYPLPFPDGLSDVVGG